MLRRSRRPLRHSTRVSDCRLVSYVLTYLVLLYLYHVLKISRRQKVIMFIRPHLFKNSLVVTEPYTLS